MRQEDLAKPQFSPSATRYKALEGKEFTFVRGSSGRKLA